MENNDQELHKEAIKSWYDLMLVEKDELLSEIGHINKTMEILNKKLELTKQQYDLCRKRAEIALLEHEYLK